jgi:2-aminoadipate transaminase
MVLMTFPATSQFHIPAGTIDLSIGQPAMKLLPHALIKKAAGHFLAQEDIILLQYGIMQGDPGFRAELAGFLSDEYALEVQADEILVTAGASQGLDLLCTLWSKPGDVILVEEHCYYLALQIFKDHGLKPVAVHMDQDGLDIERLAQELKKSKPAFLYCIPVFHNPTGHTLPVERRQALAELSARHGLRIIADEVYHLLSHTGSPPPPLGAFAKNDLIFSLGSFSKILAPGLRLGWIHGPARTLGKISESGLLSSGGGMNPFVQGVLRSVLQLKLLKSHLKLIRESYSRRGRALYTHLRELLPESILFSLPQGGYFLWLTLPQGSDAGTLLAIAEKQKVRFHPGVIFSGEAAGKNSLRLSFSYYSQADLEEGAERLAKAISLYLK